MENFDIGKLAGILQEAAMEEILPRFRNLDEGDVRVKTEAIDLVTEADEAAERMIRAKVGEALPNAMFIGEEAVAADPSLLEKIEAAEFAVIVDPIDGTFNYAAGLPLFGVMMSVVAKGETVAGIIYDPIGNDFLLAEKGAGAWSYGPDGSQNQMTIGPAVPLEQMVGIANTSYVPMDERRALLTRLADVRLFTTYRCAAHEYRTFVGGHFHFLMYRKLMPWDHLAGVLIAQEAGAHAARLDGSPYLPHHTDGGLLVASEKDAWDELASTIFNP